MQNKLKQVKFYFFGDSICFGQYQSYAKTWIAQIDSTLSSIYPHIDFIMSDGYTYTKYFKQEYEVDAFVEKLKSEINFIELS